MKKKFGPRGGGKDEGGRGREFGRKREGGERGERPRGRPEGRGFRPDSREDRPRRFGGSDGRERPGRFERTENRERPSRFGRPEGASRPGGFGRPERRERPARFDRPQGTERPGRFERDTRGMYRRDPKPEGAERGPEAGAPGEGFAGARKPSTAHHLAPDEFRFYGKNACLAIWQNRPKDIVRVYVSREKQEEFADLLSAFARDQRNYKLVDDGDLERLTDSVHHQGICVVAKAKRTLQEKDLYREVTGGRMLVLYLDGVGNPHNLGAILRTAAHFGIRYIALPKESFVRLSPAANRTSEGAAEFVSLIEVDNPETFFDRLHEKGFLSYTFDPKESNPSIYDTRLQEKAIFVFGNEVEGVSGLVRAIVERSVRIPGTGAVESLNVSVAAALAMAEFNRQGSSAPRSVRIVKSPG